MKLTQLLVISIAFFSLGCAKKNCPKCTKTIGGFTGNIVVEERTVCNAEERQQLIESSSGTTMWTCD
jgi:hypothetical protein